MFDVAPAELLLVGLVALIVIGPKELPALMRQVGYWVGKMRKIIGDFRGGIDEMMRQAELEERDKAFREAVAARERSESAVRLIWCISGLLEVVPAFFGCVEIANVADRSPKCIDGAGFDATEMGLEFGERHLDGVEVGAVGREEEEPGAALFEDGPGLFAFVARQIVEDDHVSPAQGRRELGFDIGLEDFPVHGRIDDPGRGQSVMTKGRDERLRAPMAERCARLEPRSFARPPPQPGHLGGGRRFIDEDQPVRLFAHPRLASAPPCPSPFGNVSASGFVRQQRFF